ncbi:hypothetical protein CR513_57166, partial [Mucuna pruriens]
MATASSFSQGSVISFSGTPTITTKKLNWKNYRAWSESVELWFFGQGFHDHLEKQELEENRVPWLKLDYQLCVIFLELLEILRSFKTCYSFWTNAKDVFANDVQRLFDLTQKIVSLQQANHDMVSHIAKARVVAEELKGLLVCNSVEETTKRIDKLLMVLVLRSLHPDYEHVRDQILSSEQIPSMNSLVTRLLRVPTITKGDGIAVENFAMVASCGRGRSGRGTRGILRNVKGGCGRLICSHCGKEGHLQNRCYDLIGWPNKTANISSNEEYQEFLRLKSNNHTQSLASPSVPTACISQSMGSQGPWIINSGASDHISGNESIFSSISSPKFPHFISLANGFKMLSQEVGQVSLSSSISLNSVLYIPKCPYNLISLSQLTRSLNCLVTFYADSFVIQDRNTGQLIGKGHESRGLYYLSNNPSTLCFASVSPKLLHNRLGHPSLAKLKLMVPSLNKLSTLA